jgi:hypothetical protein
MTTEKSQNDKWKMNRKDNLMHSSRTKFTALLVLLIAAGLAKASTPVTNHDEPDLPPACSSLEVETGSRLAYRSFAVGVQRYRWDGTAWVFVEPVATLYADDQYHQKIGMHYGGPTWQSNGGGKVVAAKIKECKPDPTSIAWLLLQATSNQGPGLFGVVSFIQRVNTKGGLPPIAPGATIGALADVPYTTEYYFYRPRN